MKLIKLSLVGISLTGLLTSSAFSANTLVEAIQNSELDGVLKQVYRQKKENGERVKDGFSIGGRLEGTTEDFYGFTINFGFQTSVTPDIFVHNTDENSNVNIDNSMAQDRTNMHLLNLNYSFGDTEITAGRFFIKTPLVKNRSSRVLKDFNDGMYLSTLIIPNTELIIGGIKRWYGIDEDDDIDYDSPLYTIYLNSTFGPLDITAQANYNSSKKSAVEDKTKDYYLEAQYKIQSALPITLGAQFIGFSEVDNEDAANSYGAMAKIKLPKGFGLATHYTKISKNNGEVRGGVGESADPNYNSMIITDANEKGYEALRGTIYYKGFGFNAELYYANFNRHYEGKASKMYKDNEKIKEIGLEAKYKFKGMFKGLSFETKIAKANKDVGDGTKERETQFRWYTQYKF